MSAVLRLLLLKGNLLHTTLHFEETSCITVTYYIEIPYKANLSRGKTFAFREEDGKTFKAACLYSYIANQHGHRFIGKQLR